MAVTISLYNHTRRLFANGDVALVSLKLMLLSDAASFDATDTDIDDVAGAASPARANEVSGSGWAQGGEALDNAAITTTDTNRAKLDADDIEVEAAGGNIGPASAAVIYDSASSDVLFYIDFGGEQEAGEGTPFRVEWDSAGIHVWQPAA